jgi:hypothetical protein
MPGEMRATVSTSRRDRFITVSMLARTPAALKKRRYRRRLRDGVIVINVQVKEAELAEALMLAGRLTDQAALRRDQLTRAAENILVEFADRWLRTRGPPHQP